MGKARTRKGSRAAVLTFDELFGEGKGAPYTGSLYLDPGFYGSMKAHPVRKPSKIIITTRTFTEMPNGDLMMEVSRRTKPTPRAPCAGKPARPKNRRGPDASQY